MRANPNQKEIVKKVDVVMMLVRLIVMMMMIQMVLIWMMCIMYLCLGYGYGISNLNDEEIEFV